jgi:hypothetical protein
MHVLMAERSDRFAPEFHYSVGDGNMGSNGYTEDRTALLFVDPYNDFLSEGGKLWPYIVERICAAACRRGTRNFSFA